MAEVRVRGADQLARTLRRAARELGDMEAATRQAAAALGTAAGQRAPRRTGRLAATRSVAASRGAGTLTFGVGYASPIHWGVGPRRGLRGPHNIAPTRFATEAAAEDQAQWVKPYQRAAQTALDRVRGA